MGVQPTNVSEGGARATDRRCSGITCFFEKNPQEWISNERSWRTLFGSILDSNLRRESRDGWENDGGSALCIRIQR